MKTISRFLTPCAGLLSALALVTFSGVATAGQVNLVQNGDFEQTATNASSQFGSLFSSQQVTDWTTGGYNFVFKSGTADTTGAVGQYGSLKLWGPGDGAANGLPASSPTGGNFIGADGAYETSAISQIITGLIKGATYNVSFWWAGAQQAGFDGLNTEQWQVSLGSQTQKTAVAQNQDKGFTGWMQQSFSFTADGASDVLSFLAIGTPSGVPPFALLDGVTMTAKVPEPATWAILLAGLAGMGGSAFRRRNTAGRTAG